jgi:hypothetical protein
MLDRNRPLVRLIFAVAVVWHVLSVLAPPKLGGGPTDDTAGRDFASYYYAAQVAVDGGDPYLKDALDEAARADGTRNEVHPFFYPPPFLLVMTWALPFDLLTGYRLWYWLNEAALLLAAWALWRWWKPLSRSTGLSIAVCGAAMAAIPFSHQMGQVNFIVMAAVFIGLWRERQHQPVLGGILVGIACMLKMSPAVFVAWWILHRRWTAVAAAIGTALGLSVLTIPLVGVSEQVRFYTEILPAFGSGNYNGLIIRIDMFGNHSIPNLINQLSPGIGNELSSLGRVLSSTAILALVGLLGWLFAGYPDDDWRYNGQAAAVAAASLLVPVYTYEHHLVWALPAMIFVVVAIYERRVSPRQVVLLALALAILCFPLPYLKQLKVSFFQGTLVGWGIQEAKFAALLVIFAAAAWFGAGDARQETSAPAGPVESAS